MLFICPIDETVTLELDDSAELLTPHCTTLRLNSKCPFIALGCTGCELKQPLRLGFTAKELLSVASKFKNPH